MSVARILSRTQVGLEAPLVQVELHIGRGLPNFSIVGLPALVVRESRERVRAALVNSGYTFPTGRITVNLSPVELQKQGGRFDLPIAIGLLVASGQLRAPARAIECYGELGLAGELRPVGGLLMAALHAARVGHALIVPAANLIEVALSGHQSTVAAASLADAAAHLKSSDPAWIVWEDDTGATQSCASLAGATAPRGTPTRGAFDGIVGQGNAKRALLIAAAGGHSVLIVGPPGSGKSLLASRLPQLLPPLSRADALEVAAIASVAGARFDQDSWLRAPFRAPHHTASAAAIVGGGPLVRPGEISLAHRGVLFLDELPEFDRRVLESLREPLETGQVTLARAAGRVELPAQFQLIAAMNPCPCGYHGDSRQACHCSPAQVRHYQQRISGPLLDRIDIRIPISRVAAAEWVGTPATTSEVEDLNARVRAARERRLTCSGALTARLPAGELQQCCPLPAESRELLRRYCEQFNLSGRGMHRVLAVGRTIADLEAREQIEPAHLAEAIQLRRYCASDTI